MYLNCKCSGRSATLLSKADDGKVERLMLPLFNSLSAHHSITLLVHYDIQRGPEIKK